MLRPCAYFAFSLLFASTAAFAQDAYKCKVGSTMVYQDVPCKVASPAKPMAGSPGAASIPAQPVTRTPTAATSETDRQKAFLAASAKNRKISDLKFDIDRTEGGITQMQRSMHAELAALEAKKALANNNAAGATYLNSLANERQAVTARYQIDIDAQRDRLKLLRDDLAKAQKD